MPVIEKIAKNKQTNKQNNNNNNNKNTNPGTVKILWQDIIMSIFWQLQQAVLVPY